MWQLAHWTERLREASARHTGDGPSRKSKTPSRPHTFYLHTLAEHTINVPAESTWLGTQPRLATTQVGLHWAEIPVRISQKLGEICSYWQLSVL